MSGDIAVIIDSPYLLAMAGILMGATAVLMIARTISTLMGMYLHYLEKKR